MIIHLFNGDFYFHTIPIIKNIVKHSKEEHYFLINLTDTELLPLYNELSFNPKIEYGFCHNYETKPSFRFLLYGLGFRGRQLVDETRILSALWVFRKNSILLHWYSKAYLRRPIFKSVSWVCWGNISRPSSRGSINDRIRKAMVKVIYQNYKRIVCLLEPDKRELVQFYSCEENKVEVISYLPYYFNDLNTIEPHVGLQDNKKIKVLLGNNALPLNITHNKKALNILVNLKGKIELYAIMNYGNSSSFESESFLREGLNLFGPFFHSIDEFIPRDQFSIWLNGFDVYLSNIPTQSGLGLIYNMLNLGKKVFLNGHNLDWCRGNGLIVFGVADLQNGAEDILSPLTPSEKVHNKAMLEILLNTARLAELWDNIYKKIQS